MLEINEKSIVIQRDALKALLAGAEIRQFLYPLNLACTIT